MKSSKRGLVSTRVRGYLHFESYIHLILILFIKVLSYYSCYRVIIWRGLILLFSYNFRSLNRLHGKAGPRVLQGLQRVCPHASSPWPKDVQIPQRDSQFPPPSSTYITMVSHVKSNQIFGHFCCKHINCPYFYRWLYSGGDESEAGEEMLVRPG